MTLQQLTYFLSAAEHGSFSAAAESLHMAQPSLSEQIRRLEAELGVSLFARTGRRLELTEAGGLPLRPPPRVAAHCPAESLRADPAARGGAGRVALRAHGPAARAHRGGAPAA